MVKIFIVGAGGFIGSVFRYLFVIGAERYVSFNGYSLGTLGVNVLGCLLIGIVAGLAETRRIISPETQLFLQIGVLGGFTTFSSFGYETFTFAHNAESVKALAHISLHLLLGLCAVWAGNMLSR